MEQFENKVLKVNDVIIKELVGLINKSGYTISSDFLESFSLGKNEYLQTFDGIEFVIYEKWAGDEEITFEEFKKLLE